jgi:hypothetical protein
VVAARSAESNRLTPECLRATAKLDIPVFHRRFLYDVTSNWQRISIHSVPLV